MVQSLMGGWYRGCLEDVHCTEALGGCTEANVGRYIGYWEDIQRLLGGWYRGCWEDGTEAAGRMVQRLLGGW